MDGLTYKITSGNRKALALAKTCITTPTLINLDIKQGAMYAIPLDCETNQKSASAEVSESLIISTDSKKNLTDNVAPGSRTWRLSGYIRGIPSLEPTNYFQPFVQIHTDILWSWFLHGAVLVFRDGNAQLFKKIVIKDLQTAQQKDSANATPFTMTLKEINVMELSPNDTSGAETSALDKLKKSMPALGSIYGAPLTLSMTIAETAEKTA